MTSHVFIKKMCFSLKSCQLYFLVPLSSFLVHLLALYIQHTSSCENKKHPDFTQGQTPKVSLYCPGNNFFFLFKQHSILWGWETYQIGIIIPRGSHCLGEATVSHFLSWCSKPETGHICFQVVFVLFFKQKWLIYEHCLPSKKWDPNP